MMHRLRLPLVCALLTISGPPQGVAQDRKEIKIGYIVTLDGTDRISGTAFCKIDDTCRLVDRKSPKLIIDLKAGRSFSEIKIDCQDDCSLDSGHETKLFENKQELSIYKGRTGPIVKLVWRRREPIGKIMLDFSYPPGMSR